MANLFSSANLNISTNNNMSARDEIQKILERDIKENGKKDYHPKVLFKGGKPTEKALKYNRRLIKEGLTYKYLDPDIIVKRNVQKDGSIKVTTRKIKYDKRKKGKVPLKAFQDIKKLGSVQVKGNLENKTKISYFNQIKKEINLLKTLPEKTKKTFNIDLKKISFEQLKTLLKNFTDTRFKENKKYLIARPVGTPNYIILSPTNLEQLGNYMDLQGHTGIERTGSDNQFILNLDKNPIVEITFENSKVKSKRDGAFFPYLLKIPLKLERLDIYDLNHNLKNVIDENCLNVALAHGGLAESKLNSMKLFCKNGAYPTSHLSKLCDLLEIQINLKVIRNDNTHNKSNAIKYGNSDEIYNIGLYEGHYFINEKTKYTSYAINNYEEINHIKEWNYIYKKRNDGYRRDKERCLMSYDLVKLLVNDKEKFLENIPISSYLATPYYCENIESEDLTYDKKLCLDENKPCKTDKTKYDIIYFDFETDTTGDKHIPYLMCARIKKHGNNTHKDFNSIGMTCGKDFINWICKEYKDSKAIEENKVADVNLIAHNIRYDYSFIYEYLYALNPIFKGNSLMTGSAKVYINKTNYVELHFLDSCNLITTKLGNFGDMFKLDQGKEIMPYSLYNSENIEKVFVEKEECESFIDEEDLEQYRENMKKWNCVYEEEGKIFYHIIEYSKKYCEIDIDVLDKGFNQFRIWIKEITKLDAINYCSIASLANDYMIKEGCFNDCYKIAGVPQNFIQKFVVGGRCMTANSKKWKIENDLVADYDCTSLYPSAMARMEGYLKGSPKVIKNKCFKWLEKNTDGFFVKVKCLNNPTKNRSFPLLSYIDAKTGVRDFTNNTKDKVFYLDKTGYEEAVLHQGLDFKIICGYYYNQGRNNKVNKVIRHIFKQRVLEKSSEVYFDNKKKIYEFEDIVNGNQSKDIKKAKDKGIKVKVVSNPIQEIYKLLMNSAYGKSMLKPIDSETKIIDDSQFENYLNKNYNYIKSFTDCGKVKVVKINKVIDQHFNNVYAGVEILSMSKVIMNEVMCLAENNDIKIFYQDTDSCHLYKKDVSKLEDLFREKYNRELNGKDMGQFHIDFDLKGADKDIVAVKSIFLGKKAYIDVLEGKNNNDEIVKGMHVRMKGVNIEGIEHYANKYDCNILDIYEELYENNKLPNDRSFDLLAGGEEVKFKYNNDMSVYSVNDFSRSVNFTYQKGIVAN